MTMSEVIEDNWFKIDDIPVKCSYEQVNVDDTDGVFSSGEVFGQSPKIVCAIRQNPLATRHA